MGILKLSFLIVIALFAYSFGLVRAQTISDTSGIQVNNPYGYIDDFTMLTMTSNGDYEGVLEDCRVVFENYPHATWPYRWSAKAKRNLGDDKGAVRDYTEAIKYSPNSSRLYSERAHAKIKLSDRRGALIDCNRALELDDSDSKAYRMRGIVKYETNDLDGACLDWSRAGELGSNLAYEHIKNYCN